jgi:hypothetical protein
MERAELRSPCMARRRCRVDGFPSTTPMIQARRGWRRDRGLPSVLCEMQEVAGLQGKADQQGYDITVPPVGAFFLWPGSQVGGR